jgi:hypothetical protein
MRGQTKVKIYIYIEEERWNMESTILYFMRPMGLLCLLGKVHYTKLANLLDPISYLTYDDLN